ncbi:sclerostin domain-containing protein 1a [Brachionichthys hirsutus]|uniref:sclerostin domain-containing protein 1a n=1 Tax=Brachionichthys hirsutus TaxID=412623 RepID=UPI0036052223
MHLRAPDACQSMLVLCALLRSCQPLKNDATELLFSHVSAPVQVPDAQVNVTLNRARNGGRGAANGAHHRGERSQIGCRELRSTKYISDGRCTSISPIKELLCTGECLPTQMLQNWIGGAAHGRKLWSRRGNNQDWRCVNDKSRTQRIQLQCQDGSTRTYKITAVTSCKCKRYSRQHNESGGKFQEPGPLAPQLLHKHKPKSKSKRRLAKSRLRDNWHEPEP